MMNKLILVIITAALLFLVARYWYADYLFAAGGINNLESAIALNPNEAVFHDKLAFLYAENNPKLSEAEIKKTLALSPNNVKLLKSSANIYLDLAKDDSKYLISALNIYDKLEILAPTDASVLMMKAYALILLEDYDKAKIYLINSVALKPNYIQARKLLAGLHKNNEDYKEARNQLQYILENISSEDELVKDELMKLNDIIGL